MKESFTYVEWYLCCIYRGEEEACHTLLDLGADINGSMNDFTPLLAAIVADPSFQLMKLLVGNPNVKLDSKVPAHRLSFHICFQHVCYYTVTLRLFTALYCYFTYRYSLTGIHTH